MNSIIARVRVPEFIAKFLGWALDVPRVLNSTPLIPHLSYRGHDRDDWKLLPKLCRDRKNLSVQVLKQDESDVIREYRSRFRLHDWTVTEIMAYAQHHGAPTRLLDWSRNPFIGLWFAVSNSDCDKSAGTVYQLSLRSHSNVITLMTEPPSKWVAGEDFESQGGHPVHVFSSPPRVERAERQSSVFSLANFRGDYAITPLEESLKSEKSQPLRKFLVPAELKSELRCLLSELGLDAFSIYGGPDALGKSMVAR
ncbi:MAG: FRG domain-containing protein, partial [Verrucomicrobiota bacterium]